MCFYDLTLLSKRQLLLKEKGVRGVLHIPIFYIYLFCFFSFTVLYLCLDIKNGCLPFINFDSSSVSDV